MPTRFSLRLRIVAIATLLVALVLVASGWLLASALRSSLAGDVSQAAVLRSQDLAALAAQGSLPQPIPISDDDEALVQVLIDGRVVASSGNVQGEEPLPVATPAAGTTRVTQVATLPIDDDEAEGNGFVVASTSVQVGAGTATVVVASSLEDVGDALAAATRLGLLALPVLVVVLAAAVWVLVGRALAPVDAIRSEADAITGTDLHRRVPEPASRDEIGRLARTLNRMLGRLQDASERQRRFVADAAHELRTPIASIRTTIETAKGSTRQIDWDDVTDDVLTDAIRMQQLSEQLLLLARVDTSRLDDQLRPVDLDDVISVALRRHHMVDGIDLDTSGVDPVQITGEPVLLEQLVVNLLDNAAAHATSRVSISLHARQDTGRLTVDDDGPGIPTDQRAAIFERFTRLDQARTRHQRGGAGLGLAIVADIARIHAGTVRATENADGGARLQVDLPLSHRP